MPKISADIDMLEQIPPPLPPPRGESLTVTAAAIANNNHNMNGKPLPVIPCSASAHEFDTASLTTSQTTPPPPHSIVGNLCDRPLPPLPREDSLDKVVEFGGNSDDDDEDDDCDDDNENDVADDDDDEYNELIDSDTGNNGGEPNHVRLENDRPNRNGSNDDGGFDADATLPPSPTEKSNGIFSSNNMDVG